MVVPAVLSTPRILGVILATAAPAAAGLQTTSGLALHSAHPHCVVVRAVQGGPADRPRARKAHRSENPGATIVVTVPRIRCVDPATHQVWTNGRAG
jgi:hypothetical protein